MRASQVVAAVENYFYKPGWSVTAREVSPGQQPSDYQSIEDLLRGLTRGSDADVELTVSYSVPNSDVRNFPNYREMIRPDMKADLSSRQFEKPLDVWDFITKMIIEIEVHETREFVKVRASDGRVHSPYHPHQESGLRRWQRLGFGMQHQDRVYA